MRIDDLKEKLVNLKLPGFEAHKLMLPSFRLQKYDTTHYFQSAVNIIMFNEENRLKFILTKRSNKLQHHPGQISLPGGSFDNADKDLWHTAKRETYEEIGLELNDKNFIRQLTPIPVPVSRFIVNPYISYVDFVPKLKINREEVEKIFIVETESFFSCDNIKNSTIIIDSNTLNYNYFELENEKVWGLTAMVLSEFNFLLNQKL